MRGADARRSFSPIRRPARVGRAGGVAATAPLPRQGRPSSRSLPAPATSSALRRPSAAASATSTVAAHSSGARAQTPRWSGRCAAIRRAPSGRRPRSTRVVDQEVLYFASSKVRPPSRPAGRGRRQPWVRSTGRTLAMRLYLLEEEWASDKEAERSRPRNQPAPRRRRHSTWRPVVATIAFL